MKDYGLTKAEQQLIEQLDLETYLQNLEDYRILSRKEINELTMDELVKYRKIEREMALLTKEVAKGAILRKLFHPFLIGALHIYHKIRRIRIKSYGRIPKSNRPIIFCPTHIGMYDVEILLQVLGLQNHTYLFSADEEAMYRTFDGLIFNLNGVKYVDPEDPWDRKIGYQTNMELLKQGLNVYWNAEGTWNLTESTVVLPLHRSIIEAALATKAVILPMAIEQIDGRKGPLFLVNIGEFLDPNMLLKEVTVEKINELTDTLRAYMAALKMQLWPKGDRRFIPEDYYQEYLNKRIEEWPYYNTAIIKSRTFNPNHYVSEKDVLACLNTIDIGPHNAFLARVRHDFNNAHAKDVW